MKRRTFVINAGMAAAAFVISSSEIKPGNIGSTNKLPKWKGFNILDFFSTDPASSSSPTTEDHFKWMRDWGFDFVRIPIAYPHYLEFDRTRNIQPDEVYHFNEKAIDRIDAMVQLAQKYSMHVSLNLHRAPGYCINAGFHEPFNLWKDDAAQQAFAFHWNYWAKKYKDVAAGKISFDLVNEPSMREDMNDQHSKSGPVQGDIYRKVAKIAVDTIHSQNSQHLVIADGNNVGNSVINEITDLDIAQSCRGYNPGSISHFKAPWANSDPEHMPYPVWPGQVGNRFLNRQLLEDYYRPWIELSQKGTGVHCGECGCWNKTPHAVFLAWFTDVLGILSSNNIGFALWNFIGDFGILNSGRADVAYEKWNGYNLDRKLLQLLQKA